MNPFKNLLQSNAKGIIEGVVNAADKFIQTPEEKKAFEAEVEKTISDRWKSDMSSDSWLSKNIRPLTLALVMVTLVLLTFFDGVLQTSESWIGLWQVVSMTVIGGYFAVRSVDKRSKWQGK